VQVSLSSDQLKRLRPALREATENTLLATPETINGADLGRSFVRQYAGDLCITPRHERLVEAILGTRALDDIEFVYPEKETNEEAAIAETGLGVYITVTGSTAREHGLVIGADLFSSETVLLESVAETTRRTERIAELLLEDTETALAQK